MNKIFDTYKPFGFETVNVYLIVQQPKLLINFLKKAFYAEIVSCTKRENTDEIINCIVKVGTSCFMIGQAKGAFTNMQTTLYLFVDDVDKMHKNAMDNGAEEVFEPDDMDYGDRQSGIMDPSGNYWWISKRIAECEYA